MGLHVWFWPKAAVASIRPERQLLEEELLYKAMEHDGRI
jgi:hypothetical protein